MNHVFVDFENVPSVDLSLIGKRPVDVTLLIGEKQRRLELGLVRQIHAHATQVTLIEVGASGRNALDLVLAWHLGKTAERHASDPYFVISRDRDFDPLIKHLRSLGLNVTRVESFAALPFLAAPALAPKTTSPRRAASARSAPTPPPVPPAVIPAPPPVGRSADDRLAKLIDRLQHKTTARPSRRKTLLSHINGFYGNTLPEPELLAIAAKLEERGIIKIDPAGRISYPEAGPVALVEPARRRPRTRAQSESNRMI